MKTIYSFSVMLIALFLMASCDKEEDLQQKQKVDKLYFSCKINGRPVVLKSPDVLATSGESFSQRLYKVENSAKDSALIGFAEAFHDDSLSVQIGFIKKILADTVSYFVNFPAKPYLTNLLAEGTYRFLYEDPHWRYQNPAIQNEGFYIEIVYLKDGRTFTSHLNKLSDFSQINYEDFLRNTSCRITKSTILDAKTYSYYQDALYIESVFEGKLYERGNEANSSVQLTEGKYHAVF